MERGYEPYKGNEPVGENYMTTNYLQMMIDSLNKKKDILTKIVALNEEQNEILSKASLDDDAFDANMKAKGECIDGLDRLDEGFQSLFNRVRDAINADKAMYSEEISSMKKLITEVTELGAKIEVQEARNKVKVEEMFRRERQEHKEAKRSASMAKSYYQNMSKVSYEPQFMDTKQ